MANPKPRAHANGTALLRSRERHSYYQAMSVVGLDQEFSGKINAWRFGFTNDAYAARFVETNPEARLL